MKTVLVLAQHPELAQAIQGSLSPDYYRIVHRFSLEDAEPLLGPRAVDACVLDSELNSGQGLWMIEKLRRRLPDSPLIVYTQAKNWEWEDEAYSLGVSYILTKPVRSRSLNTLLERHFKSSPAISSSAIPQRPPALRVLPLPAQPQVDKRASEALGVLRDFSSILAHSLHADALLNQFLLRLREIIGVNRAAVFLRQAPASGQSAAVDSQRILRSTCAIGLPAGLLENFEISLDAGLGAYLYRAGRILRRDSEPAASDPQVQHEFDVLGAEVAIPILDRETLVGVLTLDGRVTGEPLGNSELELIFHLLEELGLAIKNVWLHGQLASNHEMLAEILRELSSACVVISRDLNILHANKMARQYFSRPGRRGGELEFSDLPIVIGGKVYQVLKTGTAIDTFKYQPADSPKSVFAVTIVPFQRRENVPSSVLVIVDDRTQTEQLQRLEIEASTLRLVKNMADRMAHEIGNALVPLSTHQQLLADKYKDPEFRASLDNALAEGVKRISRLTTQMRFLARDSLATPEALPLNQLIEEAFAEAKKHYPSKSAKLKQDATERVVLSGDHAALRHAMAEVMLNALQANPAESIVEVNSTTDSDISGTRWVHIDVHDRGGGFPAENLSRLPQPFFTTRNVGLGLGLTVSQKIIESHRGKLMLGKNGNGHEGVVRISLPLGSK